MREDLTAVPGSEGLIDLLDRVLDRGAVVHGDVLVSLAGIELRLATAVRLDARRRAPDGVAPVREAEQR